MGEKKKKQKTSAAIVRRNRAHAYLFLAPNFIGFFIFTLIPVIMALAYSFTNYDGNLKMDFIGIDNYIRMFNDSSFRISLINTLVYTIGTVPFIIILSLLVSVLMNNGIKGAPVTFGVENPPIWLADQDKALLAVMIMIIWKGIGYYMIVYLAGLKGISKDQYEAATMDGANAWHKLIYVTIPNLRPVTFYAMIMCIINSFQVFTPIYVMTGGGPGRATSVLVLKIYEDSFQNYNFGYASAEAMILFLMILIVTLIQFYHNKRAEA